MTTTMIATYEALPQAERAASRLVEEGFPDSQISMLVSDATKEKHLAMQKRTKAPEGAATGAAIGGVTGALIAGLTTVAGIVVPGLGLLVVGPLIAALAGAGAGGALGGLVGGLTGLGFTEIEAKMVEDALRNGNVALAATTDTRERVRIIHGVFESTGALSIARA